MEDDVGELFVLVREAREAVEATLRLESDACAKLCCSMEAIEASDVTDCHIAVSK